MNRWILGIDPGIEQSAFVLCDPDLKPVKFGKNANELMYIDMIMAISPVLRNGGRLQIVIERIENHGMPVGRTTFDTCEWIGMLRERFKDLDVAFVYRSEEKKAICHHPRANDATIKQALIDRFAPNTGNHGKGTKKDPGFFYGFRADIWQAFAIAVTFHDLTTEEWDG